MNWPNLAARCIVYHLPTKMLKMGNLASVNHSVNQKEKPVVNIAFTTGFVLSLRSGRDLFFKFNEIKYIYLDATKALLNLIKLGIYSKTRCF